MALYVHLMVYMGLSLFIIGWANVYLVVCILTRITLHYNAAKRIKDTGMLIGNYSTQLFVYGYRDFPF